MQRSFTKAAYLGVPRWSTARPSSGHTRP